MNSEMQSVQNNNQRILKIAVIGNVCGGKTALSRALAEIHQLPLTHVDSIQFLAGMRIRPHQESIAVLRDIQNQDRWIIDGYGPLDIIEKRFQAADQIILIDFPLWRHYWWCLKRQISILWSGRRAELPEDCDERSLKHTFKLFKTIWQMHTKMRPELLRILSRENLKNKTKVIRKLSQWKKLFRTGLT